MICFVILHYKTMNDTKECISSIRKLKNQSQYKIVVVDNGTTNKEEAAELKSLSDQFLRLNENVGFAKGNNQGVKIAIERYHPEFIFVINSDIVLFQEDLADRIKKSFQKTKFDFLGPKILTDHGDSVNPFPAYKNVAEVKNALKKAKKMIVIYKNPILALCLDCYLKMKRTIIKPTHLQNGSKRMTGVSLHGCAVLFSKKYYEKYPEVFFNDTFLYHEEEFLTFREKKDHLVSLYDPEIEVFHKEGASLDYAFDRQIRQKKVFRYTEIKNSLEKLLKLYQSEGEN